MGRMHYQQHNCDATRCQYLTLRVPYWLKIFFIVRFYAIMHRTTIVQNKIISSISSCFFCLANIYRPSLGKVQLGRPTQNCFSCSIFISEEEKKDHSTQNCMHYNATEPDFQFCFSFIFKKRFKNFIKKPIKILNNIYTFFFLNQAL